MIRLSYVLSLVFFLLLGANISLAQPLVELDFSVDWTATGVNGVWTETNTYPGTIRHKIQSGGGMRTSNGKLIVDYQAPMAQSGAQSLLVKLPAARKEIWIQLVFRFQNWHWGNGPADTAPWYTKMYRVWDLDDANPQYTEKEAIHYALFGFSSSQTSGVMHPYYNVTVDSVVGPHPKGSSGGPHMAFRHYPYPVPAGQTPAVSSGFPEAVFGPIAGDGTIPNEDAWLDTLVHFRSATPGNDDGLHEYWVNGIKIKDSVPGPEIKYNYGSPTSRVNFPSEGNWDHIVVLDNTGALYGTAAAGAQVEVDYFAVFASDPRNSVAPSPPKKLRE